MPRSSRRSASAIARPVLPVAVGPPMTTSGARGAGSGESATERVRPGVIDRDVHQRPRPGRRRSRDVDELVLARAADEVGKRRRAGSRRRRGTRPRPAASSSSSWSWARGGTTASTSTLGRPPRARRGCARARWPPGRRAARPAAGASRRRGRRPRAGWRGCRAARCRRPRTPGRSGPSRGGGASPRTRPRSRRRTRRSRRSTGRCRGSPRGSAPGAPGSGRSCTGGPCGGASRRCRTGRAGGATRTPTGTPPSPR